MRNKFCEKKVVVSEKLFTSYTNTPFERYFSITLTIAEIKI